MVIAGAIRSQKIILTLTKAKKLAAESTGVKNTVEDRIKGSGVLSE